MKLAIVGYGLVRGPESELEILAANNDLTIIGYNKKGKMHQSGIHSAFGSTFAFPSLKPAFLVDPVSALRADFECSSWVYFKGLEKILSNVDVVITHELWPFFSAQTVKIAKRLGIPSVVIVYETIPKNFVFTYLPPYSQNTKIVSANADLFIAQTNKAMSYVKSCGVSEKKINVVNPGINLDLFRPPSEKGARKELRILFVGNFLQKGLEALLKAFKNIANEYPNIALWIVGNGPNTVLDQVTSMQQRYSIKYLGNVQHHDLSEIYRQVDIYCQPSRDVRRFGIKTGEEQFGYALVEALASGLPIVTTDCGAINEVVGNENIVVKQQDIQALENGLRLLVCNTDLRKRIGNSNRRRAEQFFDGQKQALSLLKHVNSLANSFKV